MENSTLIVEDSSSTISAFTEIGNSITAHEELDTTLYTIAEKGAKGTHSKVCLVELSQGWETDQWRIHAAFGIGESEKENLSDFSPFSKRVYAEKKDIYIKDYYLENEGIIPDFTRSRETNTVIAIPLWGEKRIIGALYFFRSQRVPFARIEKNFATALAVHATIAVQQASLLLERQSGYVRTIKILADLMDKKDSYTHGHSANVRQLSLMIADKIGIKGKDREEIGDGGYLHDLGKIHVDLTILQKPARLTPHEWAKMILHPDIGAEIVSETHVLKGLVPIIRHHHEMFSGGGYPDGLAKEKIPLGSRIVTVADAYEAMVSDRPYRKGMNQEQAIQELRRHAGTQFDPEVVEIFTKII